MFRGKTMKLSICIPTYKRKVYLRRLIENIQLQEYKDVEICISDNNSQDGTRELVTEFQTLYSNIKYQENKKNIGFDANLLKAISMASGEYVWTMGDDDVFIEGKIKEMLEIINEPESYDYIIADYINVCFEGQYIGRKEYSTKDLFFGNNKPYPLTYIGAHVFKKKIYDKLKKKMLKESYGFQSATIYLCMMHKIKKLYVTKTPFVKVIGDGGFSSGENHMLFFLNLQKLYFELLGKQITTLQYLDYCIECRENMDKEAIYAVLISRDWTDLDKTIELMKKMSGCFSLIIRIILKFPFCIPIIKQAGIVLYQYVYIDFLNLFREKKSVSFIERYHKRIYHGARDINF